MDSSGTIISIRHGESEYNYAQKEYAGQMDVRDVVTKDESKELKFNY